MSAELIHQVEEKLLALEAHLDTTYHVARHAAEQFSEGSDAVQSLLHVIEERLDWQGHHPVQQLHAAITELRKAAAA